MYPKALHSRCDKWHKEEMKASMRFLSHHEGQGRVALEKGREGLHVGVHVAPMCMSSRFPFNSKGPKSVI